MKTYEQFVKESYSLTQMPKSKKVEEEFEIEELISELNKIEEVMLNDDFKDLDEQTQSEISSDWRTLKLVLKEYQSTGDGKYIHKGTYGKSYDNEDDDDDKPKMKTTEPQVKRGRGRPPGKYGSYTRKVK